MVAALVASYVVNIAIFNDVIVVFVFVVDVTRIVDVFYITVEVVVVDVPAIDILR